MWSLRVCLIGCECWRVSTDTQDAAPSQTRGLGRGGRGGGEAFGSELGAWRGQRLGVSRVGGVGLPWSGAQRAAVDRHSGDCPARQADQLPHGSPGPEERFCTRCTTLVSSTGYPALPRRGCLKVAGLTPAPKTMARPSRAALFMTFCLLAIRGRAD